MKCIIEGNSVKVFGKAAHALSKIGEEIWLDPLEKGLAVRSVNTAHSAYACFLFSPLFFQQYTPNLDGLQDNKAVNCKISLKSVMPLFRSAAIIERSVYKCEVTVSALDNRVTFRFKCRHGITKTHNLKYEECEALKAVFPTRLCPNVLKAHPKLLNDIIMHFPVSQEEITLSVSPTRMKLKNIDEDNERIRGMYTEMSLHPDEFDYFQVGEDSDITFCLKELRGLLTFAETYGLPVSVHFSASGKPVSFSLEDMLLEAVVVLATVEDPVTKRLSQVSAGQEAPEQRNFCEADMLLHEGPTEAEGSDAAQHCQTFSNGEQVASSQGSPVFNPTFHMRKVMQLQGALSKRQAPLSGVRSETAVTPGTFKVCSLLFGAMASDQDEGNALTPPSLVYASDSEDDTGEDGARGTE